MDEATNASTSCEMSLAAGMNDTNVSCRSDLETPSQIEEEHACRVFTLVIYVGIFGTMCVFGVLGNTLSIFVLRLDSKSHVATYLLQSLAFADNLFLVTTGFSQIFTAFAVYYDTTDHPVMAYNFQLIHPLVHITQLFTVWVTVLVSFNRYIAICKPFRTSQLCTFYRVRMQIVGLFIAITVYCLPRFFEFQIDYVHDIESNSTSPVGNPTSLKSNKVYNILYENILYCIFVFLGPLFILIFLNASLIRELIRAHKRLRMIQLPGAHHDDQDQNITLVMVVIVVVFLFCQTPAYINQILYYALDEREYDCGRPYYYYFHISNLVVSGNSTVNFFIYCVFRRQFRQRLKKVFCSGKGDLGPRQSNVSYSKVTSSTQIYDTISTTPHPGVINGISKSIA